MARFPVATGNIPNYPLTPLVDTQGKVEGIIIQNVSAVDCFVSDDPQTLQQTNSVNLPVVGLHFPPDSPPVPFMLILPAFRGKLYARAQGAGALLEVIRYEICPAPVTMPVAA